MAKKAVSYLRRQICTLTQNSVQATSLAWSGAQWRNWYDQEGVPGMECSPLKNKSYIVACAGE